MTRLISMLVILLLTSCMSDYDKREVTMHLMELKELNQILIKHKRHLNWKNDPETIAAKIPETQEIIESLRRKLNLTNIEFYEKINGHLDQLGMAYRFGNPKTEQKYSFLIFTQDQKDLDKFRYYEQFRNCGKSEFIEDNWAFSRITVDCDN